MSRQSAARAVPHLTLLRLVFSPATRSTTRPFKHEHRRQINGLSTVYHIIDVHDLYQACRNRIASLLSYFLNNERHRARLDETPRVESVRTKRCRCGAGVCSECSHRCVVFGVRCFGRPGFALFLLGVHNVTETGVCDSTRVSFAEFALHGLLHAEKRQIFRKRVKTAVCMCFPPCSANDNSIQYRLRWD